MFHTNLPASLVSHRPPPGRQCAVPSTCPHNVRLVFRLQIILTEVSLENMCMKLIAPIKAIEVSHR